MCRILRLPGAFVTPLRFPRRPWRKGAVRLPCLLLTLGTLLLSGCGVDSNQVALCRSLIPAFEAAPETVELVEAVQEPGKAAAVRLRYRAGPLEHWIVCRYATHFLETGRYELTGVTTDRTGTLSAMRLVMLRIWSGLPLGPVEPKVSPPAPALTVDPAWQPALFLLQQVINAATLASVYGLLALGYTLVYAILGQINLAMAELTMVGAVLAVMGAAGLSMMGLGSFPLALLGVLLAVMGFTAVHGWAMDRLVFRRLRGVRSHTPLIAAIGLAIAYQEGVRLLHGAREWWPTPILTDRHDLVSDGGFTVTALSAQGVILLITGGLYALLWGIMRHSRFGRAHRACTDDAGAAALMGVDIDRTVATTFSVGGALAAAAGTVIAFHYGGVSFYTGYLIGFKALAAAVVGGIGSVPGAMLGGTLLAVVETFWSAYFVIAYKDVVAFVLLTLFLIFRPDGLLGQARSRGD